jgi:hypothetical protein
MPPIKNIIQLSKLIAQQHGWPAAKAFKSYEMTEADQIALSQCAVALLKMFPAAPNASAMMSAALAVALERHMKGPIHVVAGTLVVEGEPVFGDRQPFDASALFGAPTPAWNGHAWVMIGDYIVDISIFRTAYSADGPAKLAQHIDLHFGTGKGLYVDQWKRTRRVGLHYEPQYVLSADEVTAQMGAAFHLIEQSRGT